MEKFISPSASFLGGKILVLQLARFEELGKTLASSNWVVLRIGMMSE
jgi:hypothetical protein